MSTFLNRVTTTLSLCAVLAASAFAATPKTYNPKISVSPQARITEKVDITKVTAVPGTTPGLVASLTDMGRVPAATQFDHMMLVLKPSDEQEYALHTLLDEQQDKTHGNYHQWMTPETFGAAFGVASSDIAQVSAWLQASGFTVEKVAKGARIITFSGTSGAVEAAFHTEMHNYMVNGEVRMSNSTDISIPKALAAVVVGPSSLNNFRPKHSLHALKVAVDAKGNVTSAVPFGASPDTSVPASGSFPSGHFVGGADLATIYDTNPLFAKGIQGQGVTMGIMGQTDVLPSDIQVYRSVFGLPANNYTPVLIGSDPGIIADDGESDLDLEVSGAMAPLANQIFYTSGLSAFGGGVDTSMEYVVEDNAADVVSESYGECEYELGTAGNAFYAFVYEQGAAQGQSIFISTGDDGPDTCGTYYSTANPEGGYNISGLSSTPYNVAVGGTQFIEGASYNTPGATPYWSTYNTASPYESALSFIPDEPWNESVFGTGALGSLTGGGSGISLYYGTPSWQVGPGVPTKDPAPPAGSYETAIPAANFVVPGPHRYVPDVSLNASVYHDGTIFCSEASCTLTASGALSNFGIVGGTSVAAPTMAGAQALVDQMNGGRQGNPNYYYYKLAAMQSATKCIASNYVATAGCAFHDSQVGNNDVPAVKNSTTLEIGWNAGPQYDLAVGLDSPDVANLATNWTSVNFNATTTAFTITPTTGAPGDTYNVTVTVAPASGTGTPSGDVAIIAQALYGGLGWITLSGGTGSGSFSGLPGGTYCIYAHYSGDTSFGGSSSPCVSVTISTATPVVGAAAGTLSTGGAFTQASTFTYGSNIYFTAGVNPPSSGSGFGIPSGNVTFTLNNGTVNLTPFTTLLNPNGTEIGTTFYNAGAFMDSGIGVAGADIAPNYPVLAPGTYKVTVSYAGDTTFKAASAPVFTIVVGPGASTVTVRAVTTEVAALSPASIAASVTTLAAAAGGVPATGTFTFVDTTTNTTLGTSSLLVGGAVTFTTSALATTGAHSIVGTYSGDANYSTKAAAAITITVGGTATTTTLAQPASYQVGSAVPLVATVAQATSGTVTFLDNGISIGTATVGAAHTATLNIATLTAGTHPITASYGGITGTTPLDGSTTAAAVSLVITKNTPTLGLSSPTSGNVASGFAMQANLVTSPLNIGRTGANPAPTGNINFLDVPNGGASVSLGSAVAIFQPGGYETYVANYTATNSQLVPGNHVISAQYVGDSNYAAATSNTLTLALGITTLAISTSATNVGVGTPFTLTGTVTPAIATSTAIGGTITFYDGTAATGTVIGTAAVVNGIGALTAATLNGLGTHKISAVYSGDANFYTSSASSTFSIVSVTPGYTIAVTPTSATLPHNGSVTVTVSATSFGNYAGIGSLSCSGLPANAFCPFNAFQQFTFTGVNGTQNTTLVITALNAQVIGTPVHAGLFWIPAILFAGLLALGRKRLTARGRQLVVLAILFCGMMAINGCSGGNDYSKFTTPLGSYTVTLTSNGTGAAAADPSVTATATLALTVN